MRRYLRWTALLMMAGLVLAAQSASASVLDKTDNVSGLTLHYKVVLPNGYDPAKAYPTVIAFPGGGQTMDTVDGTLYNNWKDQAEKRGYIVLVLAAPNGRLFFEGGEKVFPAFFDKILADYNVLDKKFHIAGVSNGGISAFHIASLFPQYFWSVTGLPGFLPNYNPQRIHALSTMCINMYAGEDDQEWVQQEAGQAAGFRAQGMKVQIAVEKGQGHVMASLSGEGAARLFDQFEEARKGNCTNSTK